MSREFVIVDFLSRIQSFFEIFITLDGLKYANVELDLVRSSRQLFLKFGRNTLLSYATRLAKNWGREFISCAVKCRTLIFLCFESDTSWLSCWSIWNPDSSQRKHVKKWHAESENIITFDQLLMWLGVTFFYNLLKFSTPLDCDSFYIVSIPPKNTKKYPCVANLILHDLEKFGGRRMDTRHGI